MASSESDLGIYKFDEYNPHPYGGGYDIQKTYGRPLPPSPDICYPIPSSASSPVSAPPPIFEAQQQDSSGHGKDSQEQVGGDKSDGYGIQDFAAPVYDLRDREVSSDVYSRRPSSTPFDEVRGCSWTGNHNSLNWVMDYLFTYFRHYGDKRAENFSYGNLNYAYERHQPQEPLSIQFRPQEDQNYEHFAPQEHYQEQELFGFFNTYEEKVVESHEYSIPSQAYEAQQIQKGLFNAEYNSYDHNCSYDSYQPQETLSILFNPQDDYQEYSSGHGADLYQWSHSKAAYVEELPSPPYNVERFEEYPHDSDAYCLEQPNVVHESAEHDWHRSFDIFGIFDTHERSHPEDVHAYEDKYHEQSSDHGVYDDQAGYHKPAEPEFDVGNFHDYSEHDSWHRSVEQSFFSFGQHSSYND